MGQTDKQFGGFLRMVITSLRKAIAAPDIETMRAPVSYTHLTLPTICSV